MSRQEKSSELAPVALRYVQQHILLVRSHRVMLDRDLARIYGVETRVLNQAVKRNRDRFPADFMFALSRDEILRISQIVTSSAGSDLKFSKQVHVFTEHGVAMLSSVLNSSRAIQVNIQIMRAFASLRRMIAESQDLVRWMDALERTYDAQFKVVFDAIRKLMAQPASRGRGKIGFRKQADGRPNPQARARVRAPAKQPAE